MTSSDRESEDAEEAEAESGEDEEMDEQKVVERAAMEMPSPTSSDSSPYQILPKTEVVSKSKVKTKDEVPESALIELKETPDTLRPQKSDDEDDNGSDWRDWDQEEYDADVRSQQRRDFNQKILYDKNYVARKDSVIKKNGNRAMRARDCKKLQKNYLLRKWTDGVNLNIANHNEYQKWPAYGTSTNRPKQRIVKPKKQIVKVKEQIRKPQQAGKKRVAA